MVVGLLLVLNFSTGVSASSGYDRQEADACITIGERLSVKEGSESVDSFISKNVHPSFQKNVKEAFGNDVKVSIMKNRFQDLVRCMID